MTYRIATLLVASASLVGPALAVELEGVRAPAQSVCPSPEEAQKKMTVPEGYAVRCWAHEPMVQNPVAMTWDARGRLWVVEAYEYPEGTPLPEDKRPFGQEAKDDHYHPIPANCIPTKNQEPGTRNIPKDRVVILEDTDNDGEADKRTVFVEGLNLASAMICGDDGIYVGQQPHLIHFKDSNHDDKPDEWRVILTGFGREDTHELVNSFCWGPDGWLYMTHGVFTNSKVRRPGVPEKDGFKFDAGIGRCRPTSVVQPSRLKSSEAAGTAAPPWEFEVFADGTSNPWGCDYDERGNFFVSACVIDHFFHMAPGGIYVRQGGAPENPYSYELLPSIVTHKHFRAAYAGVQIYQGGVYPKDTWGHAFIGNIHDNAIHEEVLTPVGATFKCEPRRDFLRANDGWFRPVSTRTGPDGNLWIMDWCDKYPCYQNAKANPEGVDREKGRIWRVVSTGPSSPETTAAQGGKANPSPKSAKMADGRSFVGDGRSFVRDGKGNVGDGGSFVRDGKGNVREGESLVRDGKGNVREGESFVREGKGNVREGESLVRDGKGNVREGESLVRDGKGNVRDGDSLVRDGKGSVPVPSHDHSRPETTMDLSKLDTPALVKLLGDSNNWMRRWARRELSERTKFTTETLSALNKAAYSNGSLEAFWSLENIRRNAEQLKAAESTNLAFKTWFARSIGDRTEVAGYAELSRLATDQAPEVRSAVAVALKQYLTGHLTVTGKSIKPGAQEYKILSALLSASKTPVDAVLPMQIWMALEAMLTTSPDATVELLASLAPTAQPFSEALTYKSMRRLCDTRKPENLDLALDFLTKIKAHDILLAYALDGLEKGQESGIIKPTKEFSTLFAEFAKSENAEVRKHAQNIATLWGDPAAVRQIAASLLDAKTPEAQRIVAVQTLRKVKGDEVRDAFVSVLSKPEGQPSALIVEVIRAAGDTGGDAFIAPLTKLAASKDYGTQLAALGALSNREAWIHAMLDAIKAKTISAVGFPASVRRQLATSKDKGIRDHAYEVLGAWKDSSDDVKALIAAKKQACLTGEPDIAAGKVLFQTACMVCHSFHGGGQKVGPDLIGSGRSNLDAILANVIDPNQIIGNGYENFIISTKDNRTLMGRVTEDTPSHVKLLAIGGAETVIPRDQIAKSENTHQSLMPMGFGALPDDQFRNLVWYVLAPPEEGPLTPDKKKQLSTSIDAAPGKPKLRANDWRSIDWESVSLWNPQWKVTAPEFEGTPIKRAEYHERTNVLTMHPFDDRKTPAVLEQKLTIDAAKSKLKFSVAADDRGDWMLKAVVNGQVVKEMAVDHEKPRWKDITLDLSNYAGKEVTVRLEAHPTGWSYEFSYWHNVRLE